MEVDGIPKVCVRLNLSYDGAPFNGWGIQPNVPTIQGTVEAALEMLFRRRIKLTVAGRTDAGVHARGQVASFILSEEEWIGISRGKDIAPTAALQRRLMGVLALILQKNQGSIVVNEVLRVPFGFNARFSALWRRYSYRIVDDPRRWDPTHKQIAWWFYKALNVEEMNEGARLLRGQHDFAAYCKKRPGSTTVRTLQNFQFERKSCKNCEGPQRCGDIVVTVQADAFCHNMARALISAVTKVGLGEQNPEWLRERLDNKLRDKHYSLAPAHPLVLEEVAYPNDEEVVARTQITRARRSEAV